MNDFIENNRAATLVNGKPRFEDQSANGVKVLVTRSEEGSTVRADCQCFGSEIRAHSTNFCALLRKQRARKIEAIRSARPMV